jgi:hypothetical protein
MASFRGLASWAKMITQGQAISTSVERIDLMFGRQF